MKLNMPLKILIGLATAWVMIYPLLLFVSWFMIPLSFGFTAERNGNPPYFFFVFFMLFMFISIGSTFLQALLQAFYISHIILNKTGSDVARVILGIFNYIFPFLAMPIYFFIYILPISPPDWAQAPAIRQAETPKPSDPVLEIPEQKDA